MKREMLRRNYSHKTIVTYADCVKAFLKWSGKELKRVTKKDVRCYLQELAEKRRAASTVNVHLQSIKFLLENHLGKRMYVRLPYSKVKRRVPTVLSKAEIVEIFSVIKNEKQLLLVELMYSAGLRVSEVVKLHVGDLDLSEGYGWVRAGKGGKDRPFIIARKLQKRLLHFTCGREECAWVFRGQNGHYSVRSVQEIIKRAARKARIKKNVHPHTLRHSFATHLIEEGYGVASVQGVLGHASAGTTMGYVHLARPKLLSVESPYDTLHYHSED
jgi:integrase/recombinase XerD